ncbi:MAG: T9SS type A sorting domain-containing protein [Bacteroidota bacterium]|nr:T9SS type A sorting domain-containing protein [Bacteroidota bacterium]
MMRTFATTFLLVFLPAFLHAQNQGGGGDRNATHRVTLNRWVSPAVPAERHLDTPFAGEGTIGAAFERTDALLDIDRMVGEPVCFTLTAKDKNGNVIRSWNTTGLPTTLTLVGSSANTDSSTQSWNDDPLAYSWATITLEGGGALTQISPNEWSVPASAFNDEGQCRICLVHTKAEKGVTIRVTPQVPYLTQETDKINFHELETSNFLVQLCSQVPGKDAVFHMRRYEILVVPRDKYLNTQTTETTQTRFSARWPGEFDNTIPGLADIFSGDVFISGPTNYAIASRIIREQPADEYQWIIAYASANPAIRGQTNPYEILSHEPNPFQLLTPADNTGWVLDSWTSRTKEDFTWERPTPPDPYTDIKESCFDPRLYSDEVRYTCVFVDSISLTRAVRIASNNGGLEPALSLTQGQLVDIIEQVTGQRNLASWHLVWYVEATDGLYVTKSTPPENDPNNRPGFHLWGSTVSAPSPPVPAKLALRQNFPNPFNPSTRIAFSLPSGGHVSLKVYDLLGSYVATITEGEYEPGEHQVEFRPDNLPPGIYIYKLQANGKTLTRRMTLLK